MTVRNPKQEGSNVFDCKPQSGLCPLNCNQCFYNREGAFYVDIHKPHIPTVEEVGGGIVRVNCGHDSNIEREKVIKETEIYQHRFFNTAIPKFDFPGPVVFTANPKEGKRAKLVKPTPNLMFVRLRVSSTNLFYVQEAIIHYTERSIPVVLTFMAYYDKQPRHKSNYEYKVRHINSYWCPTVEFMERTTREMKLIGGRQVVLCGNLNSYKCADCRNCETYYWQTIKHMNEAELKD